MFWSFWFLFCLALAIPVDTKNVDENVAEQTTLTTFLVMTWVLLSSIYIASISTDSSSEDSDSKDSRVEIIPDQPGDEVEWEFVRTGKSVSGNIYL